MIPYHNSCAYELAGFVKMFYKTHAARRPILAKIMVKKHAISRKNQLYTFLLSSIFKKFPPFSTILPF